MKGGKHRSKYELVFGTDVESVEVTNAISYTLKTNNLFDQFKSESDLGKQQTLKHYASSYLREHPSQVRVKSLGIPEMDTIQEVVGLRSIMFSVHDLSKERITGQREIHWLSGIYTPIALKHTIRPSEGYLTEIKLLRDPRGTSSAETSGDEDE